MLEHDTGHQGVHWSSGCALVIRGVHWSSGVCTGHQGCALVRVCTGQGCALVRVCTGQGVRVDTGSGVEWHIATRSIQKDF